MAEIEAALGLDADPIRRLAALNVFVVEDAERLWQRLRLSNAEHERLASMGEVWWRRIVPAGDGLARPWLYRLGPQHFIDRVLLAWARAGQSRVTKLGVPLRRCRSDGRRRSSR